MELLLIGGMALIGVSPLLLLGRKKPAAPVPPESDEDPERCNDCGSYRRNRTPPTQALFAPGLHWTTCPACGAPDPRPAWVELTPWD